MSLSPPRTCAFIQLVSREKFKKTYTTRKKFLPSDNPTHITYFKALRWSVKSMIACNCYFHCHANFPRLLPFILFLLLIGVQLILFFCAPFGRALLYLPYSPSYSFLSRIPRWQTQYYSRSGSGRLPNRSQYPTIFLPLKIILGNRLLLFLFMETEALVLLLYPSSFASKSSQDRFTADRPRLSDMAS